jgi:hypothetical protein
MSMIATNGCQTLKALALTLCLAATASAAIADDRLVLKVVLDNVGPGPAAPAPVMISGTKFEALRKDVEAAVAQLGKNTEWSDFGPDATFESLEIYLGGKRYVLNTWYFDFRDAPRAAVSESQGIVSVSGPEEKRLVEAGNSERYRSFIRLFEKVHRAVGRDGAPHATKAVDFLLIPNAQVGGVHSGGTWSQMPEAGNEILPNRRRVGIARASHMFLGGFEPTGRCKCSEQCHAYKS